MDTGLTLPTPAPTTTACGENLDYQTFAYVPGHPIFFHDLHVIGLTRETKINTKKAFKHNSVHANYLKNSTMISIHFR